MAIEIRMLHEYTRPHFRYSRCPGKEFRNVVADSHGKIVCRVIASQVAYCPLLSQQVREAGRFDFREFVQSRDDAVATFESAAAHIAPAAKRCGIGHIGWHIFRYAFRRLLDETGAPLKMQWELIRHADIRTTINIYRRAIEKSKYEAHGKIVRLVLASQVA